jgi:hypothetical protein
MERALVLHFKGLGKPLPPLIINRPLTMQTIFKYQSEL